jgi:hypothetical protein
LRDRISYTLSHQLLGGISQTRETITANFTISHAVINAKVFILQSRTKKIQRNMSTTLWMKKDENPKKSVLMNKTLTNIDVTPTSERSKSTSTGACVAMNEGYLG